MVGAKDEPHRVDEEDASLGAGVLSGQRGRGLGLGSGVGVGGFLLRRQGAILPEMQDVNPTQAAVEWGTRFGGIYAGTKALRADFEPLDRSFFSVDLIVFASCSA